MELLERLAHLCAREAGAVALLRRPDEGEALSLLLLCTRKSLAEMSKALPRLAGQAGALRLCTTLQGGLFCLYDQPPALLLRVLPADRYVAAQEDTPLWSWRTVLSEAPRRVDTAALLQKTEERVWLLILHAVALAERGETLEALDCVAELRHDCLLPLLEAANRRYSGSQQYRAGNFAAQLLFTHPVGTDIESIKDALEAVRQIYFALRYELAGEDFTRLEACETLATRALAVEETP